MARLPSVIVEFPVLDAVCNLLNKRATGLWFYFLIRANEMPLKSNDVIKDYKISKTIFYKCMAELELYNLCFVKNGKVYFYHNQVVFTDRKKVRDNHARQSTGFGSYGGLYDKRAYDPINYGKSEEHYVKKKS